MFEMVRRVLRIQDERPHHAPYRAYPSDLQPRLNPPLFPRWGLKKEVEERPSYRDVRGKPHRQELARQASRSFPCRGTRRGAVQLTNAPQSGMEEDGRCCVACTNRRADGCRRDPAICPGARGPRSAAGSAPPSAGPPTWSLLIWSRQTGNNPLFSPHGRRRP